MSGKRIELPSTAITVGRKEGADILIQDPATSGRHCRLSVIVGQLVVEDLGSSNGTFVDEESVEEPQVVAVGSMVQVGNSLFKHEYRNKSEVEEEERLAGDLDKASRYVRSLLPAPLKTDRVTTEWRFIPSDKLGGDAFGYHWITDEKFAIYLVDVSGHGTAPALHSVAVLNLLSKQALPGVDFSKPADVLAALNRSFRMEDHGNMGGFNWSSQHLVMEVFRWELASVRVRFERCVARCGHLAGPRQRGARTGSGSGRRSLVGRPARTPQQRLGCRRLSGRDGSGKLVECDLSRWLRCRGVICRSPSVKRSPSFTLSMLGYVRSLAAWVVHRRRFRGSCAATRRLAAVP